MPVTTAIAANAVILGWIAFAFVLQKLSPDLYYLSVQEDEYLEWATFWAFLAAAVLQSRAAVAAWRAKAGIGNVGELGKAWFWVGLAVFCAFVAMEEISWAQRMIGYRAPEYFLRENFQQEPNLHNVFSTDLRKLALGCVIGGYGIVLPVSMLIPRLGAALRRGGVVAPSPLLMPAFAGTLWLYIAYPWSHSNEIVELMLGFGFLFVALGVRAPGSIVPPSAPIAVFIVVVLLGAATAAAGRTRRAADEAYLRLALDEIAALKRDFLAVARPERGRYATHCNLHKRIYSYVKKYRAMFLRKGHFAALEKRGLPEERAAYFLDPWNMPYWIRDYCDDDTGQRAILVYSFGPNRRRDSTRLHLLGDDVGAYILRPNSAPE